ncbi:MAG: ABC transporter substrate-binding protein [Rhodospirillales bacterium]|nr:ABC transporter substrate-binding protein [Rhodospirillales bacterium]
MQLLAAFVALLIAAPLAAGAAEPIKRHGIAMHGEPKYSPNFTHFDYVNPGAPKGGTLRLDGVSGTFDTFNPYNDKGTAASAVGLAFDTLMVASADEPFTRYGLLAESFEVPEDRSWIVFHLRPEAHWHDGQPITAEDVEFSFRTLVEKGAPLYRFYYQSVTDIAVLDERTIKFTFAPGDNRELPLILGEMPVLPKHYWKDRDFTAAILEPPLGSGPYKVSRFEIGRFVDVERVKDYWGRDLPVMRGQYNYDSIRFVYFRDRTVTREALKAGRIDFFSENSAKEWAIAYDVDAVRGGFLKKERFLDKSSGGMQAFYMNTRRPIFSDRRVRQALAYAFDFQWTNKAIYYGQYEQPASYFAPTELAASGLPQGEELKILERYRGRVPDEVFTEVYTVPKTDGSGWPRENLKTAFAILAEAGWVVRDLKLVNAETGQPFSFEFLYGDQAQERVLLPFVHNLKRLGIDVRLRLVDTAQYINRFRATDFDMMILNNAQSLSPGNEQREYWGSEAADRPGSRNIAGIKDPAIDELIDLVIAAPTRESLIQRTRALDRVLLWGHYVIPQLIAPHDRFLFWDKFGRPTVTPLNGPSPYYWWIDPEKDRTLAERRRQDQTEE